MLEELARPLGRRRPAVAGVRRRRRAARRGNAAQGLEGVVAKRADAPYRPGRRTPEWQKLKLRAEDDFPIVGYTRGTGRRAKLGALVLGRRDADGLHWAGNVGSGLGDDEVDRLLALLRPLERATSPLVRTPKMPRVRAARRHLGRAGARGRGDVRRDGRARGGSARRSTSGSATMSPVERAPIEPTRSAGAGARCASRTSTSSFWPDEGITKGELLAYYRDVAAVLVPHLRRRPFTMKRYPDGWQGKSFFQKQAPSHMPDWIAHARRSPPRRARARRRVIDYALVDDELALLWMVNMGCIDMHAWASRVDRPERPDWVMFDLDPSEGSAFEEVVEVALLVRQALDLLELESVPKTSGSRGIHVLVPIARRHGFDEVREFAGIVAGALARAHPGLVTTEWTKAKRQGRARRREPERAREDDGVRLLGAPAGRRTGLDAAPLGRGAARARPARRSRWTSCSSASRATATSSRACSRAASRSAPRCARSAERPWRRRHESSRRGCPSAESSAMSRRKKSETVQSVTTRSLAAEGRQRVEVVRPRHEPAGEAAQPEPGQLGDPLVAAERRDLAEHPVAVGLRPPDEVLREPPRLAEGVLAASADRPGRASSRSARRRSRRAPRRRPSPSPAASGRRRTRPRSSSGRPSRSRSGLARTPAAQTSVLAGILRAVGRAPPRARRTT